MSIWHNLPSLEEINALGAQSIVHLLDIRFEQVTADSISASMPVDARTHQPYGLLHGGASVVLAESVGSTASNLVIDRARFYCVGLEVNANHLRALRSGRVHAVARPLHLGRSTHVWDIRLAGDDGKPSCIARLTVAVIARDA